MPDEVFARVAAWWDRSAMLADKRALLSYVNASPELSTKWWEDLDGQLRWRLVEAMRALQNLSRELDKVLK